MISGIILAAGRSSRMGAPKALLDFQGRSFLERIVGALRSGGCDDIIVVVGPQEPGNSSVEIQAQAKALGGRTVVNPDQDSGQIDSLRAALRVLPDDTTSILSTPVDAPGVTDDIVRALIYISRKPGVQIVLPTHGGRRGHPVLFNSAVLNELLHEKLPEGARTVLHRDPARVMELPVDSPAILLDIDTPADYERLRLEQ